MKEYLKQDPWKIIEEGFHPENNLHTESCFSTANGTMGQRANFEEQYTGESLPGCYIPIASGAENTKADLKEKGHPQIFTAVINAPNWIGIDIHLDGEVLDLATAKVKDFKRVLNMQAGILERSFTAKLVSGKEIKVKSTRFCSMVSKEAGVIRYSVKPLNFEGVLTVAPYIDADVVSQAKGHDEKLWNEISKTGKRRSAYILSELKESDFRVCSGMKFSVFKNKQEVNFEPLKYEEEKYISCSTDVKCKAGDEVVVCKYAGIVTSSRHEKSKLTERCEKVVKKAFKKGFQKLLQEHSAAWEAIWKEADMLIEGDLAAQQAIRFNIFQLFQTYGGGSGRVQNIHPKGFTGDHPGNLSQWDTETFCLPFFLAAGRQDAARHLLNYRYKHLPEGLENAEKLGFTNGAAFFPASPADDETSLPLEIYRNGAIAFAIYDYIRYTGDKDYLAGAGLEVLIAIARFWAQRVHFSQPKQQYVIHGVTGPNDYELNVNNNWFTNTLAIWCLRYAAGAVEFVQKSAPEKYAPLAGRIRFSAEEELKNWREIADNMYLPEDKKSGIFLQQEGYFDKEMMTVHDLDETQLPLNEKWSRDRILRSCFLNRADVLQGIYQFEDPYDLDTVRRNFDFYEPRTVHESPLSACIHAILAARLGSHGQATGMFLRAARFDPGNYNNDTDKGLHIAGMAGAWMAFVKGFGGMEMEDDLISFKPYLPEGWQKFTFKIHWRGFSIQVSVSEHGTTIVNLTGQPLTFKVFGQICGLESNGEVLIKAGAQLEAA